MRGLNTGEYLLDTDADLCATGDLLDLTDSAALVVVGERAGFVEDVCEFGLRVDVRDGDFGVEAGEEVELRED